MFLYWTQDLETEREWAQTTGHRGWSFQMARLISEAHNGGGHFAEAHLAASRIEYGDRASWVREWGRLGEKVEAWAMDADRQGRRATASARYLRASNYYRTAEFWAPRDDEATHALYEASVRTFRAGGALASPVVEPVEIPYEGTALPGYVVRSPQAGASPAPCIVYFGGADTTAEELYFISKGLLDRGLHLLLVDGPGQGGALRERGLVARPDWEVPAGAAYDFAAGRDEVDPAAIGIVGMSFGGYHAPRAAAYDHRFAACVAWPPNPDIAKFWASRPDNHPLFRQWMWLTGTESAAEFRALVGQFTLVDVVDQIECPTLVVVGEGDGAARIEMCRDFYDRLTAPKSFKLFAEEDSGAAHCQMDNLTLATEYVGDWLASVLIDRVVPDYEI